MPLSTILKPPAGDPAAHDGTSGAELHKRQTIALDANISKIDARKAVDAMIRVTVQSLREGERLTLTGLGTFSVQQKAARIGRNPRTGAAVKIPPRKVIKFRPTAEVE